MKLKINDVEYKLNWSIPAFQLAGKELGFDNYSRVLEGVFTNEDGVMDTLTYSALLLAYRIQEDDKTAKLPFGEMVFVDWVYQQPQEVAGEILEDMLLFSQQGKSWAERFDIDMEKLFPKKDRPVVKKKVTKQVSSK